MDGAKLKRERRWVILIAVFLWLGTFGGLSCGHFVSSHDHEEISAFQWDSRGIGYGFPAWFFPDASERSRVTTVPLLLAATVTMLPSALGLMAWVAVCRGWRPRVRTCIFVCLYIASVGAFVGWGRRTILPPFVANLFSEHYCAIRAVWLPVAGVFLIGLAAVVDWAPTAWRRFRAARHSIYVDRPDVEVSGAWDEAAY